MTHYPVLFLLLPYPLQDSPLAAQDSPFPRCPLSPPEETAVMTAPGVLCDTLAHSASFLAKGHKVTPWSFNPDHMQIIFGKILFSPSWEPAGAEGRVDGEG